MVAFDGSSNVRVRKGQNTEDTVCHACDRLDPIIGIDVGFGEFGHTAQ